MKKPKILFVDDDVLVLRVAQLYLGSKTTLVTTETGYGCLSLLEQKADYDLILLDFMLPDIDGIQLLKQIKENSSWNQIPVIVQTGMNISPHPILKLGADILYKPYSKKDLYKKCIKLGIEVLY